MIVCTCGQRNASGSINYCTRVSYSADKTICMCMCRNCPDMSSDEAGAGREMCLLHIMHMPDSLNSVTMATITVDGYSYHGYSNTVSLLYLSSPQVFPLSQAYS